jgi:hypothetical protein
MLKKINRYFKPDKIIINEQKRFKNGQDIANCNGNSSRNNLKWSCKSSINRLIIKLAANTWRK